MREVDDDVPAVDADASILLDQTTICEASRLLVGAPTGQAWLSNLIAIAGGSTSVDLQIASADFQVTNAERLVNLALLLDAVVLYEHVLVVRGELPADAANLPLRRALMDQGVVEELNPKAFAFTLAREIGGLVRGCSPRVAAVEDRSQVAAQIESWLRDRGDAPPDLTIDEASFDERLRKALSICEEASPIHWWMRGAAAKQDALHEIGAHILDQASKQASGSVASVASHLRTLIYWRMSDHLRVPVCVSPRRLPVLAALRAQVHRSTQHEVYGAVAKAFDTDVSAVTADDAEIPLALPPSLALFLGELQATRDAASAVSALRARFAPLRRRLADIQARRANGALGTRLEAKRELAAALAAAAGDAPQQTTLRDVIDLVPEVTKMAAAPLDPTKYSAALVLKPAEWIRRWWSRRPIQAVLDVRRDVAETEPLTQLLGEATGVHLAREEVARFNASYAKARKLFLG